MLLVGVLGCGEADPTAKLAELNETNVQRVANLYFAYQKKHNFNGPPNEEAFKSFVTNFNPTKLERMGIDPAATSDLFTSSRDGQPFKIRYGVRGSAMGSQEAVVFEAEGVSGTRMVGFLNLTHREVDAIEYEQLWSGKVAANPNDRAGGRQ